ncbi:hypothetical protein [Halobacillus andaensis]|uniref:hypothetical protein n=1 Tax=Halobacillus andaensis TaxID=1176239 RepID=UPI003D73F887
MIFKTNRIINTPIKITTPVNIIAKFIPKGLNQEAFGGIINCVAKTTDTNIVRMFVKITKENLTFIDKRPAKITNNNVPKNKKESLFGK